MRRAWSAGLVGVIALALTRVALAEPGDGLRITYHRGPGAESCPTEPMLRADIVALAGSDPFDETAEHRLECEVRRTDDGYRAELRIVGGSGAVIGRRDLVSAGPDCSELGRALGITIAMVIERPEDFFSPPEEDPALPEPERAPAEPRFEAERPRLPVSAVVASAPLVPFAVAGVGAALDTETHLGARLRLGGGLRRGAYSAELVLRLDSGERLQVATDGSVSVSAGALVASPCYHRSQLAFCGVVSAGWLRGSGHDLEMSTSAVRPQLGAGGRVAWSARASRRIELRVSVEAEAALSSTTFSVDGEPAWQSAAVQIAAGVAAVAHFP